VTNYLCVPELPLDGKSTQFELLSASARLECARSHGALFLWRSSVAFLEPLRSLEVHIDDVNREHAVAADAFSISRPFQLYRGFDDAGHCSP
jgi:hypothetical protein